MNVDVETKIDYSPEHFQHMAGLIFYYDTGDYVYLAVSYDEEKGKVLKVIQSKHGVYDELLEEEIPLPQQSDYYLQASLRKENLTFSYSLDGTNWEQVIRDIDSSHLSDDDTEMIRFTGTFVGVCAQDLSGQMKHADFGYFNYEEINESMGEEKDRQT